MNKTYLKGYIQKAQEDDIYEFIASTSSVDRQGDSIDQNGWELENFQRTLLSCLLTIIVNYQSQRQLKL